MRVLQVSTWGVACGIADYTAELRGGLQAAGVECDVAPIDREETSYMTRPELRAYFAQLAERFADADIVHIQHEFGFFAGSYHFRESLARFSQLLRAARAQRRPTVVTFHTIPFELDLSAVDWSRGVPTEHLLTLSARTWWRARLGRALSSRGVRSIVHGRGARRRLVDSGVNPRGITIIPHGTPKPREPGDPRTRELVRERLGLPPDGVLLGIFGFLSGAKGHATALHALRHLPSSYQLLIAGGQHPNDRSHALSDVLDRLEDFPELAERVAITGYLSGAAANECLDTVDIMLAPYRDSAQVSSGAFGWALASSKPVVAGAIPTFREIAGNSGAALLVSPDAPGELALAIRRIEEDPRLRAELVARARDFCLSCSWERVAGRHADVYEQLLGAASGRSRRTAPDLRARAAADRAAIRSEHEPGGEEPAFGASAQDAAGFRPLRPAERAQEGGVQWGEPPADRTAAAILRRTRLPGGEELTFALDPRASHDPLSEIVMQHGYPGDLPAELVLHLLRPGQTLLDVGAHMGTFTLAAGVRGCRVLAVEASATNARLLRAAVAYNGLERVEVVHGVAAASDGTLRFRERGPFGHVADDVEESANGALARETRSVAAYELDPLIEAHGIERVDFVKLDIEGYETEALKGLTATLSADPPPLVLFEANATALGRRGETLRGLKATFERLGYHLALVDREQPGRLVAVHASDVQTEASADYLAFAEPPPELAPWHLSEAFSHSELARRLCTEAAHSEPGLRAYAAAAIRCCSELIRADPLVRTALLNLQRDPDPAVQNVLSGATPVDHYGLEASSGDRDGAPEEGPIGVLLDEPGG